MNQGVFELFLREIKVNKESVENEENLDYLGYQVPLEKSEFLVGR